MKLNQEKCHTVRLGNKGKDSVVTTSKSTIKENDHGKFLRVTFGKQLSFTQNIEELFKKANQNLHVLARLSNYIDPMKLKLLMDKFIKSQFSYCPLVSMFHKRRANTKLNKVCERAL